MTASESPSDRATSHGATSPSAIRIGMIRGAQNGTKESATTSGLFGSHGAMVIPMMYGIIISVITGAVTEATSSCRDTSAASAPRASAYVVNPMMNQTTTQSAV